MSELAANDHLIERMQVDIRRKHDEIERKQKHLDKLNREFDDIMVKQGSDSSVCPACAAALRGRRQGGGLRFFAIFRNF